MRRSLLIALLLAGACTQSRPPESTGAALPPAAGAGYDLAAQRAKFAVIAMNPDTSFLNAEERRVVNLLIQAADLMNPIYLRQKSLDNPRTRQAIERTRRADQPLILDMFDLHFGPWDSLAGNRPFWGDRPMPPGGGFYPEDLTREQLDAYLAAHPGEREALLSPYTVVRRQGDRLVAVPYAQEYHEWLEPAARLLEEAARITSNASLRNFLNLRAQAFRTNDYFASEVAWMQIEDTPIEPVIGPYEVYTDNLMGQKTAFEAYITLRNPTESAALDRYKALLPDMERNLPVAEQYRNANRPFNSPILVVDQIRGGGDNVPAVQSIAFNLPNDERVRAEYGAKKIILSNVLGAKFERILSPMAEFALVPGQAAQVSRRYMTLETVMHELSHSLGPGIIRVNGRETTVNAELRDVYSASEEGKADVMGVWNMLYLMRRGELPIAEREEMLATYFVGIFRAVRFGAEEAHGRGAAVQYSYLREKGAFTWDARARRFRVDYDRMEAGIRDLVGEFVRRQGDGDYAGMQAFLNRYGHLDAEAEAILRATAHIPTDIRPDYPEHI